MSDARIYSQGYRDYTGARSGVRGAMTSVAWHAARSVLGIGRPARYKVLPLLVIITTFVPSIVFVGLAVLIGDELLDEIAPPYSETIGNVLVQVLLFTAFVVPAILVRDRQNGMLSMYLSTPLERHTYLFAKAGAVLGVLSIVTIGPSLFQLIGYSAASAGPGSVGDWLLTVARIIVAGLVVAISLGLVAMAASSLTSRPLLATVGVVMLFLISSAISDSLQSADFSPFVSGISLTNMIDDIVPTIFGEESPDPPGWFTATSVAVWNALSVAVIWLRYRRIEAIR